MIGSGLLVRHSETTSMQGPNADRASLRSKVRTCQRNVKRGYCGLLHARLLIYLITGHRRPGSVRGPAALFWSAIRTLATAAASTGLSIRKPVYLRKSELSKVNMLGPVPVNVWVARQTGSTDVPVLDRSCRLRRRDPFTNAILLPIPESITRHYVPICGLSG